ncbi:MAG: hypothetical protein Kow00108_04620 [Calditrichia bacterium]
MKIRLFYLSLWMLLFSCVIAQQKIIIGFDNRYGNFDRSYKAFSKITTLINSLSEHTWEVKIYENQTELINGLTNGEIQVAKLSPLVYATSKLEKPIKAIALGNNAKGQPYYFSSIIVHKNSGIKNLRQLENKKIAFGSVYSASSFLIAFLYLDQIGLDLASLNFDFLGSQTKIVLEILDGKYDGGAIRSDLLEKVRPGTLIELYKSTPIPESPLVINTNMSPDVKNLIIEDLTKFDSWIESHPDESKNIESDFRYGLTFDVDEDIFTPLRMAQTKFQQIKRKIKH